MMHEYQWHDRWLPYWHMGGMWIWPIIIFGVIAAVVYFTMKGDSGRPKK